MSDTLQEGEDARRRHEQIGGEYRCNKCRAEFKTMPDFDRHKCVNEHQVTKSGTCVIPGCPCRGWSAEEAATVVTVPDIECQFCDFKGSFAEGRKHRRDAQHLLRTAATGRLRRSEASAASEHQPAVRGGGDEWRADEYEGYGYVWQGMGLLAKCPEPSRAEQIVTEHNQHQALVAERESFARLLKAAKFLLAMNATNYDRDVMRSEGGFDALQKAVDTIEKGLSA